MATFQELKEDIIKGKLRSNKYILYSKDEYSIKTTINEFKKIIQMPELNVSQINLEALKKASDVVPQFETIPFMSRKRLVLMKADFLYEEKGADKLGMVNFLKKYDLPDFTILVMYFYCKDKRENLKNNKNIKNLIKSSAVLVTNPKNQAGEIKQIIDNFCRKSNKKLDKKVSSFILSNSNNIDLLRRDLNKLKFMDDITINSVKKVFTSLEEDDIWDLTNAISEKNGVLAIEILNNLITKGFQPVKVLYSLIYQYELLMHFNIAMQNKLSRKEIAEKLNIRSSYRYDIICSQTKKFSLEKISESLRKCINLETKVKTESIDSKSELELLIVSTLL